MVENGRAFQIVANVIMFGLTIFCLFPFALLVVSSFTDEVRSFATDTRYSLKSWGLTATLTCSKKWTPLYEPTALP